MKKLSETIGQMAQLRLPVGKVECTRCKVNHFKLAAAGQSSSVYIWSMRKDFLKIIEISENKNQASKSQMNTGEGAKLIILTVIGW